eukprot:augustus_masked-scaffold_31-processed-gene-3.64-mRNA-1 protein AED:0.09 eAED:1.00 QI:0/-1/0/1/-1/1/1/0/249
MSCCPESRVDFLKKAPAGIGTYENLDEKTEVYVSGDPTSNKVMVFLADIFGMKTGRHCSLCDFFADKGYFVIMPNYFTDSEPPTEMDMDKILAFAKSQPLSKIQGVLDATYAKYNLSAEGKKVSMIGFCYGCWVMFHESQRGVLGDNFKAGINCHPSVNLEGLHGGDVKALCESIKTPMLLIPTIGDVEFVQKGGFLETDTKYDVEIVETDPIQQHGFVSQGDAENDENIKKAIGYVLTKSLEYLEARL